jgi:hypothetical protein
MSRKSRGAPSQAQPAQPTESVYSRYMRIGYAASKNRNYQTALINFKRALEEKSGDASATQVVTNRQAAIEAFR